MPKGKKSKEQEQYENSENQREELEKERFKKEWMKEYEDDTLKEKKEIEESEIREKKLKLLSKMEQQFEESEEKTQLSESWKTVLENPRWEEILRTYFGIINGMTNGMCAKTVITVTETNGQMNFSFQFFDKDGRPIITQFNKVEGEE